MAVKWRMGRPVDWDRFGGTEYTALGLLPPDEARRVWQEAWRQAFVQPTVLVRFMLVAFPLAVVLPFVLFAAKQAGWGWGGRVAAEVIVHVVLAVVFHRPLSRMAAELNRPFVREQLLADYG